MSLKKAVRSAVKSNVTASCNQILCKRARLDKIWLHKWIMFMHLKHALNA